MQFLSSAALAVFSGLCDLHSAQAYVDPYSSAGVIFTDLLQQPQARVGLEFFSHLDGIHSKISRAEHPPAAAGLNSWENHTFPRWKVLPKAQSLPKTF